MLNRPANLHFSTTVAVAISNQIILATILAETGHTSQTLVETVVLDMHLDSFLAAPSLVVDLRGFLHNLGNHRPLLYPRGAYLDPHDEPRPRVLDIYSGTFEPPRITLRLRIGRKDTA